MRNFTRADTVHLLATRGFKIVDKNGHMLPADDPAMYARVSRMAIVKRNGNTLTYDLRPGLYVATERDYFGREVAGCTETYNSFHKRRRQALTERINALKAGAAH